MSIRSRIILLLAIALFSLTTVSGYAIFRSRASATDVRAVTEGVVPSALAAADLAAQLKSVQIESMALVYAPDKSLVEQFATRLAKTQTQLKNSLAVLAKQADSDTQRGLISQAEESLENYFAEIRQAEHLALAGQNELAEASLFANVAQYQNELEQVIQTLRVEKNRRKDQAIDSLNSALAESATAISVIGVLAFTVLAVLSLLLYRRVAGPISNMQAMMTEIARSRDYSRRLPKSGKDEIGLSIAAFNQMIEKIQESSVLLEKKTNDIQTLLQNMPQGVLSVGSGNVVNAEYSAYLETILETRDIAGRHLIDLVFSNTSVGTDELAQVDAACGAFIGEDVINYEMNAHLLTGEVRKTYPDGRVKTLDLSWSPIMANQHVGNLLLCVRDVTELRKLAAEAQEQKRELEIIGEILAVTQEKFHEFISASLKHIDENEILIRQTDRIDIAVVAQLFRNMHTVKGNARTYGLRHLTNAIHDAEQTYDALRTPRPSIAWDAEQLIEELAVVRNLVERYARINEVSLGRKGPGRRGSDRYLLIDRHQVQDSLDRLERVNTANIHELVAARNDVRQLLRLLGTERLSDILSGVFDSLPSLAAELDKVPPTVSIDDGGYLLKSQVSGTLKNVFMHLLRNALDHGIESADERRRSGKTAAGNLRLTISADQDRLSICLSDDGRGLALTRIREIGVERGLVRPDAGISDEQTAMLIFRPGFSTAERVTEVSGRGVGMDAVQEFVRREGGSIHIRLLDDLSGAAFRSFETIIELPRELAVFADDGSLLRHRETKVLALREANPEAVQAITA